MKKITYPLTSGSSGASLTDLHDALMLFNVKGVIRISDEEQAIHVKGLRDERASRRYGESTRKAVRVFQETRALSPSGEVDQPTADAMSGLLGEYRSVIGRLVDVHGRGLAEMGVGLFEYDLTGTTPIDMAVSAEDGSFGFVFKPTARLARYDGTTTPDLCFQVADGEHAPQMIGSIVVVSDGQEVSVPRLADNKAAPIVIMNAAADLVVRIEVRTNERSITEFERLVAQLMPFTSQVEFADLKEDESHFQISFLTRESGIERAKIEQLRDAFGRQRESNGVPAWVFFGLTAQGLALASMTSLSVNRLVEVLAPVQPSDDQSRLDEIAGRLLTFLSERDVQTRISGLKTESADWIRPVLGSDDKLHAFMDAYARHDGDTASFWSRMAKDEEFKDHVPAIQLNLQLAQLTLNNAGMVEALKRRGIENTRQLVDIGHKEWVALALAHKHGIPEQITGVDEHARADAYASHIQAILELALPHDVIKKTITHDETLRFLENNAGFDFTTTPVEKYLHDQAKHQNQPFAGIQEVEKVKTQLRRTQRLYNVTANAQDTRKLIGLGFESAHQIAELPLESFIHKIDGAIAVKSAQNYHDKASYVRDAAAIAYHALRDLIVMPSPAGGGQTIGSGGPVGHTDIPVETQEVLRDIPNWETLFQSLDMCECEHCKSVYSPAAYFVDLLHILLGQNGGAARNELFRRRPDLRYTRLSCEHTETLIPYIDLVNEVLETYVAQDHVGDPDASTYAAGATNDTSAFTAPDLAANPQYSNTSAAGDATKAYKLLAEATYPLNLPFDMNLEMARRFLAEQKSSRYEVMEAFGQSDSLATLAENLGISADEFKVLTLKELTRSKDAGITPQDLWGLPPEKPLGDALPTVDAFLEAAGIAYGDLISLLSTRFLNPNFPIDIFLQEQTASARDAWLRAHPNEAGLRNRVVGLAAGPGDPCDLGATQMRHLDGTPLSEDELSHEFSRFNRFIRLWRKLGCAIPELDGLLTALDAKDITPEAIESLSHLWQFNATARLALDDLAVLVGSIPTAGKDALYSMLFLNKAILKIDPGFHLNAAQTDLEHSRAHIKTHLPGILAAYRISEEELRSIATYISLDLDKPANLHNLSLIYRYVVLAKGLRITIKALITWLNLIYKSPPTTPAWYLDIQRQLARLRSLGPKPDDLAYIFHGERAQRSILPPSAEIIQYSAQMLRDGLLKIRQEHAPKKDGVTAEFLKNELGLILEPVAVSQIIAILEGPVKKTDSSSLRSPAASENYKNAVGLWLTSAQFKQLTKAADRSSRFDLYWSWVSEKLTALLRKAFVQQHLTAAFKIGADVITLLLQDPTTLQGCLDVEKNALPDKTYAELYIEIHKFIWLATKLKLAGPELAYFGNNKTFGKFDWRLDFNMWLGMAEYVALRDTTPTAESDWLSVFAAARQKGGKVADAIVAVTGWDRANVEFFVKAHKREEFLGVDILVTLQKQISLSEQIGVSIEQLRSWATEKVSDAQAQDIKRTLKAKYDETGWIEISTRVHNELRTRLRDGLVAYLLQKLRQIPETKGLPWKGPNDLYAYFLIDVEMDACMLTSRLKQAIASVQLFVQRCLLNLEAPAATPRLINADQWKWMKNYRVWEANRKVFLYPENWIEPELRDDKSPFFKELESELLQGEISSDFAEQKLKNYLEKLGEVARLDICGTFDDVEGQERHVFGRNFNSPPQYFYRKQNLRTHEWTAWERVPLDIQGSEEGDSAGTHLMPVVWNRRLYLFWALFAEKNDQEKTDQQKEEYEQAKKDIENRKLLDKAKFRSCIDEINKRIDFFNEHRKHVLWLFTKMPRGIQDDFWEGQRSQFDTAYPELRRIPETTSMIDLRRSIEDINKLITKFHALRDYVISILYRNVGDTTFWENNLEDYKRDFPEQQNIFEPTPEESSEEPIPPRVWKYTQVRIAWSEYRQNRWSKKQTSQAYVRTPSELYEAAPTWRYRFLLELGSELLIKIHYQPVSTWVVGEFRFNPSGKIVVSSQLGEPGTIEVMLPRQVPFYQGLLSSHDTGRELLWNESDSTPLTLLTGGGTKVLKLLDGSEKDYKILFPDDYAYSSVGKTGFFYQDDKRNYYVDFEDVPLTLNFRGIADASNVIFKDPRILFVPKFVPTRDVFRPVEQPDIIGANDVDKLFADRRITASTASMMRVLPAQITADYSKTSERRFSDTFDNFAKLRPALLGGGVKREATFKPFFHAYVDTFLGSLNAGGIDGLLTLKNQQFADLFQILGGGPLTFWTGAIFETIYRPNAQNVAEPYPREEVDFSPSGAYSKYNWELFFHAPLLVANRLSNNQRFEEAMRWYHFIFNPATTENPSSADPRIASTRFWQVIPFRNTATETLQALMRQLHYPQGDSRRSELEDAIAAWRDKPFNPHLIARMRLVAYQKTVVMKYLDNLIAWGDYLFHQDTIEALNQATHLYVLAAEILGKHPENIPARGDIEAQNYDDLEHRIGLDAFSNALVKLETTFPFFDVATIQSNVDGAAASLGTNNDAFYFCLPSNPKLLSYWDTIADRLFKIRHCQNIEGIERQLSLFEKEIDPALLVRAVAGGIDIDSVLSDLNSPLPYYRFSFIVQKAIEICAELKSLGNALLSALEKQDAEALTLMRGQHETMLLTLTKTVRKLQAMEAQRNREGLEKTREVTDLRAMQLAQLLKEGLNSSEKEYQTLSAASMVLSTTGQVFEQSAAAVTPIPDTEVGSIAGACGGPTTNSRTGGGDKTAKALRAFGGFFHMMSTMTGYAAATAQTNASNQRRADEWKRQLDVAKKEIAQIDKQILAATIREQIAEKESSNLEQQIENSQQVAEYLRNKYTQQELYGWMTGELSTIYFQCYQLAYDLAKKAEKTYRHELGLPDSNFIQFGIWDSFRKGLMSGERLYLSLKQMEKSFMDQNRREYEITKHVSLLQLDPFQLIALKETGECTVSLPESLFDMDFPGHYMRRLKGVSLTVPCVAGPYTSVNCTLTLTKHRTRITPIGLDTYSNDMTSADNPRVTTSFSASESIATSSAQNDSGLFEFNFRDERYLPFEGSGAVSEWRIELANKDEIRQFDYDTISDVVLHIRYTARQGGGELRGKAVKSLNTALASETKFAQTRLFSLRHEFPTEWYRLQHVADENGDHKQAFSLDKSRFPLMFQGRKLTIQTIDVYGVPADPTVTGATKWALSKPPAIPVSHFAPISLDDPISLDKDQKKKERLAGHTAKVDVEVNDLDASGSNADWTIKVNKPDVNTSLTNLKDILILCHYSVASA